MSEKRNASGLKPSFRVIDVYSEAGYILASGFVFSVTSVLFCFFFLFILPFWTFSQLSYHSAAMFTQKSTDVSIHYISIVITADITAYYRSIKALNLNAEGCLCCYFVCLYDL